VRILAFHPGAHDAAAAVFDDYTLIAAVSEERLTRSKGSGGGVPWAAIDEVLGIAGWTRQGVDVIASTRAMYSPQFLRFGWPTRLAHAIGSRLGRPPAPRRLWVHCRARGTTETASVFAREAFLAANAFRADTALFFANHHESHALPALFFTEWDNALIYTADGIGDNVSYSVRQLRDGVLTCHYGDDRWLLAPPVGNSLAYAYAFATVACGFQMVRHEGKLTGLAARGEPALAADLHEHFWLDEHGLIAAHFRNEHEIAGTIAGLCRGHERQTIAASIQQCVEDLMLASVQFWLRRTGATTLGLGGGLFGNVSLNRLLADRCPIDEAFVFPAMGDEGLPVGAALSYLLARDGLPQWLSQRRRLEDVYLGRDYDATVDAYLDAEAGIARLPGAPATIAARLLVDGQIGAIYAGRMEYGPRALGARTILASPISPGMHDTLNRRLERSEFMPFAPCVLEEDCARVFEITDVNRYAARFMTITCAVRPEWRSRVPAIVHVDGTARPQVVRERHADVYAEILRRFRDMTGIPVLINTSFNVHEEPIVNTPADALGALRDGRIDFLVTNQAVYVQRR
jgi:carbamoyltransferase